MTRMVRHWLIPFGLGVLGTYLLFIALALGALAGAHWALWLAVGAGACFAIAIGMAAPDVRRMLHGS